MANARVWIWQPLPSESLLFALWRWALTGWFHKWLATGCELLLFVLWCATVWWNKPNWLSLASAWFWLGICLALPRWLGWWSSLSVFVAALDLTIGFYSLAVETAVWVHCVQCQRWHWSQQWPLCQHARQCFGIPQLIEHRCWVDDANSDLWPRVLCFSYTRVPWYGWKFGCMMVCGCLIGTQAKCLRAHRCGCMRIAKHFSGSTWYRSRVVWSSEKDLPCKCMPGLPKWKSLNPWIWIAWERIGNFPWFANGFKWSLYWCMIGQWGLDRLCFAVGQTAHFIN